MKRLVIIAALLLICIAFPTPSAGERHSVPRYLTKETTVDMRNMNRIFVGWVNLDPEEWAAHGYATKTEWTDVIAFLNAAFASNLQTTYLPGRTIVAAKNKDDTNAAGCELHIKFSDIHVDYNNYHLILSIHFIDPKTNTEIGSIPVRPYLGSANIWGFEPYLEAALKEVGTKLQVEVLGGR